MSLWQQTHVHLPAKPRGFHLITTEVTQALASLKPVHTGLLQVFILHTSASLSLNENADPTVRADFEQFFNRLVPENQSYYQHTLEGSDDLPAHIKASLIGFDVHIPIHCGKLALGTWQGIYLGEHRNHAGGRKLLLTLQGS